MRRIELSRKQKFTGRKKQSVETRGCVILETEEFGLVALLPIGMSPVSSVTFEPTLNEGVRVRKGDMLGHFLFGGSDFVMVFQAGYDFTLDSPRNDPVLATKA